VGLIFLSFFFENYFLGSGGISPTLALSAATAFTGDKSFPLFHASRYFHGNTSPRLTHHVSAGVGQEIPK
jgi:hypothetical protein